MAARRVVFPRTLQARFLLALALLGVVPLGLVGLGMATLDRRALAEQSARELTGLAIGLAGQLDVYITNVLSDSRAIAALPEVVSMDPVRQDALLKEFFHHYPAFARISTFDRSGQVLASSHPDRLPSIAQHESFQTAVQRGHQAWEVTTELQTRRWLFLIHTPIRDADRRVVGVAGTPVDLVNLSTVVEKVSAGGVQAFVLDAGGRVLLHPDREAVRERRDYAWLGVPTGGRPASPGIVRYKSDGAAYIAGYAPVPNVGWTVVFERSETEVLAPAARSWHIALVGLATSGFLAVLTAVLLARTLTRPLRELAVAAGAFAVGDSAAPLPAGAPDTGEIGTLVEAFATMREAVAMREAALWESERQMRSIIETANDPFISIDANGLIIDWNRKAETIFGWSREDVMGRPLAETIIPLQYREAHLRGLRHFLTTGEGPVLNRRVELTALRRGGEEFPVELNIWAIRVGPDYRSNAFVRDISERQQAQRAVQQANAQLQSSVTELEARTREITSLSDMSHLLQSCLTVEEAHSVISQFMPNLFPGASGALYLFSASRNVLDGVAQWGESPPLEKVFGPEECWALRRGRVHVVEALHADLACHHIGATAQALLLLSLCVPIMAQGQTLGLLHVLTNQDRLSQQTASQASPLEVMQRLAGAVAEHTGLAVANLQLRETLHLQSIRDPLTGLFNRRYMEESLERELFRAARNQAPLGLVMLDLDHFKRFNDTFGHAAGDVVLQAVGGCLQTHIRREDIACRYGGEELLLIMPGASVDVARQRAERLREAVKALTVYHLGQLLSTITISAGVATFPEHGATADDLLQAADAALYRAKAEGRDRVVIG